jgi:UDP-2-acetamido-2,6-beta-L-arabino-hexul-4-ose reductase
MKKILITGSQGFIGKNLKFRLKESGYEILEFDRDDNLESIKKEIKEVDFVFHLAGVNRPKIASEFYEGNSGLTGDLLKILKENKPVPVVLSSSIQVENANDYGKSKLEAEEQLIEYSKKTGQPVFIYRLPNVFGKWSKPNYNSFVATFCYNISRGIPIIVNDENALVQLTYIDDVVGSFFLTMDNAKDKKGVSYCQIDEIYNVTVGEIARKLKSYQETRNDFTVKEFGLGFDRALYATYLSFFDKNNFLYDLKTHQDDRGSFVEFIKTSRSGQFSFSTSNLGVERGNHYHHTKNEKFLVIKGEALLKFKNVASGEYLEYKVSDADFKIVDIPPGWAHSIENIGQTEMLLLIWSNEIFEKENPDTFFYQVSK